MLPHIEADDSDLRRSEPLGVGSNVWSYLLPAFPGAAQLRPAQNCSEPRAVPPPALLHDWLRTPDLSWFSAVSCTHRARVDSADAPWIKDCPNSLPCMPGGFEMWASLVMLTPY